MSNAFDKEAKQASASEGGEAIEHRFTGPASGARPSVT